MNEMIDDTVGDQIVLQCDEHTQPGPLSVNTRHGK